MMDNLLKCLDCPYQSRWKFSIKEHIKVHKLSPFDPLFNCLTAVNDFKCFICKNYQTDFNYDYKKHLNKFHKNEIQIDKKYIPVEAQEEEEDVDTISICDEFENETAVENSNFEQFSILNEQSSTVSKIPLYKKCVVMLETIKNLETYLAIRHLKKCPSDPIHSNILKNKHMENAIETISISNDCVNEIHFEDSNIEQSALSQQCQSISNIRAYKCAHCDVIFRSKKKLRKHIFSKHINNRDKTQVTMKCKHCQFKTLLTTTLKNHILSQHAIYEMKNDNFFHCEYCEFKILHKDSLKEHMLEHHNSNSNFQWYHSTANKNKIQIEVGIKSFKENEAEDGMYKCVECNYASNTSVKLKWHILRKHTNEEDKVDKYFICDQCTFKTLQRRSLRRHILAKHSTEEKKSKHSFGCGQCGFKSLNKTGLQAHIWRKHKTDEEKIDKFLFCYDCGYKTLFKDSLKQHILYRHTRDEAKLDKFFHCSPCGYKTINKSHLKEHILKKHMQGTEKEKSKTYYNCRFCEQKSLRKWNIELHEKKLHKNEINNHVVAEGGV